VHSFNRSSTKLEMLITIYLRIFSHIKTENLNRIKVCIDLLFHRQNTLIINLSFTLTEEAGMAQSSD
jgi:hypothetical protein